MPLRDHFHAPLGKLRHWESFHARWATLIADALDADLLPPGYFAEVQVHVGARVEVDIATFDEGPWQAPQSIADSGSGTATATLPPQIWTPPAPAMVMPAVFPDRVEVLVFNTEAGPTLMAVIELVSPRNKDRAPSRRAFVMKCANYLHHGIGLVVVDVVTNRRANLHNEMVTLLELPDEHRLDPDLLYALAYRPIQRVDGAEIQVWPSALEIGHELPTLPLPLDKGQCVPLDLEGTYSDACQRTRLPDV